MSRKGGVALAIITVALMVGMGIIYFLLFKAMFAAADDGDTAKVVAYGVLLLVLFFGGTGGRSKR